ncbi:MAG TPA: hypothetical protein VK158_05415 [Acidobacteriota bacterium]|nr:hypothetical protein [Acidobacteriota bacterium]
MNEYERLALDAFCELYPHKANDPILFTVVFSNRHNDHGGNIKYRRTPFSSEISFHLSNSWKSLSPDLVKGLMQSLLLRLFKKRLTPQVTRTLSTDLYDTFLKKLGDYAPVTKSDPVLVESFKRINAQYFDNLMEQPNLVFGDETVRKLGHYHYPSDTIMIASTLKERTDLIDYVMHHEMLHKKHKFYTKNGKSFHHHSAFRRDEQKYANAALMEKELSAYVAKKRWSLSRIF